MIRSINYHCYKNLYPSTQRCGRTLIYGDGPDSCRPLDYRWLSVHTSVLSDSSSPSLPKNKNKTTREDPRPHTRIRTAKRKPSWKATKEKGRLGEKRKKVIRRSFKSSILLKAFFCSPSLTEHIYFCVSCLRPLAPCVQKALML